MTLEQQIASRIQQYLPDLRKQIRLQITKHLAKTNNQILEQKTNELRQFYTNKLQERAKEIKENINANLKTYNAQIAELQSSIASIKSKKLTEQQKAVIVEETVEEIVNNKQMLEEIKVKLYPQVEEKVFEQLEQKLCADLEQFQKEQQTYLESQRAEWQRERYDHWRAQSERDIEVLEEQHKQLEYKKNLIQQSLASRKAELDSLLRQQKKIFETNSEIAYLKNQIRLLS